MTDPQPSKRELEQLDRFMDITESLARLVRLIIDPEAGRVFLAVQKTLTEALAAVPEGQATTTVEEHPISGCSDCGGPFQAGRLSGNRVRGRWVHERTCPDPEDEQPENELCIHCGRQIGDVSHVFVDRVDVGWRGWAHQDCWTRELYRFPKQSDAGDPQPIEPCVRCKQPFAPDEPARLIGDGSRWRHFSCPCCWLCFKPLGLGEPEEWVNLRDDAGMAHLACWEAAKRDAKQDL